MPGSDRPSDQDERALDASFVEYHATRDLSARNRLIAAHAGLARQEAFRLVSRGEPMDDLLQVAQVGLLKAVERFDPGRGVPFTAFARPTIAGELRRHFRDTTWVVRVPGSLKELHGRLGRTTWELTQRLGHRPSAAELARELGCTTEDVLAALDLGSAYRPASLSTPFDDEDAPIDLPTDDEFGALAGAADRVTIRQLLVDLPQRERLIVYLRFFAQLSQTEIADRVGMSQVHVSRLLRTTLAHLKERLAELGA
jgi:RNA polymerase sigma-B factor